MSDPLELGVLDAGSALAGATVTDLWLCALIGLVVTGGSVRDHRLLHLDPLPAGEDDRRGVARPGTRPTSSRASPRASSRRRAPALLIALAILGANELAGIYGIARRGHGPALALRADRRARRLRADHRQRRRHRRDGGPAGGRPQRHRPARRGRQHDQGRDQGLRDRLRRARGAGAVRGVRDRARRGARGRGAGRFNICRPRGADRPADRRDDGLPVRGARDRGRRPRRRPGGRGGAPPVPREARGSWRARRSPSTATTVGDRHRRGAARDDPPVADPDRGPGDRRPALASRRSAAC